MFTLSNFLSFIRAPLALVFLQKNVTLRVIAIVLAMISDSIDGYFARRNKSVSKFGAILDPVMDKFFVYFVLLILFLEKNILLWQVLTLLSRDFALILYGISIVILRKWPSLKLRPIRWGKVTTAMQFLIIIGITLGYNFSWYIYALFVIFGILALAELIKKKILSKE
jgi:phosphatidylglycerophosphate synthase